MTDGNKVFYLVSFEHELRRLVEDRAFEIRNPATDAGYSNDLGEGSSAFRAHALRVRAAASHARRALAALTEVMETYGTGATADELEVALTDFTQPA